MMSFNPVEFIRQIGRLEHNYALYLRDGWNEERRAEFLKHYELLRLLEVRNSFQLNAEHSKEIINKLQTFDDSDKDWIDEVVRISRDLLCREMALRQYFEGDR